MMYRALDVARYVINYSNEKKYGISNLKLQKILYFIQAYFLVFTDAKRPCFSDRIEAWDFGPVVPSVYHEFKRFGSGHIPAIDSYIDFNENGVWSSQRVLYDSTLISKKDKAIIDSIVDQFADYSATDLVTITHHQAPWKNSYIPYKNCEITQDAIRRYYNGSDQ